MSGLNRRQALLLAGAVPPGWARVPLGSRSGAAQESTKKVLFFTKSSGFQHSVINVTRRDSLGLAERTLIEIGKEHGFEVVASKDGRLFEPDKIGQWDAFVF